MKRIILILFTVVLSVGSLSAQRRDSIDVDLLTCSPGSEIYSLYGHTALRVYNRSINLDLVFNYGVFDFSRPYFGWHFAMGECDYLLLPVPYMDFRAEYDKRGSRVVAQRLNLTCEEKNKLFARLIDNAKPENAVYRYNYLTNNCTTKVLDMIESCIDGEIVFADKGERTTYREIMHRYTTQSEWAECGNDILLGAAVDTVLSYRATLFVPENLEKAFDEAKVRCETRDTRPLVSTTEEVVSLGKIVHHKGFPLTPVQCSVVLFALCLVILALESFLTRQFWCFDVLLMTVQGVAGVILCFLFAFSQHPTLDSNCQIWLLNPLPLVGMYFVVKAARKGEKTFWHGLNFGCLFLFILFIPWVPQDYCAGIFPCALSLMTRPISYFLAYRRQ